MDAELVADPHGTMLLVDGHPQSHVDLDDPTYLLFEYVQHLAMVLDDLEPPPPAPLRVTHIGGAALTLPRYVEHTRPGSPQIVLEPAAALTERVRRELPLPRRHRIRVRPQDGRTGLAQMRDASADVIVLDAFAQGRVPADLVTQEAFSQVHRVLVPGGVLLANLADEADRAWVCRALASATAAGLVSPVLIGLHEVLKGKRFGNVVLAAYRRHAEAAPGEASGLENESHTGSELPPPFTLDGLRRLTARMPLPTGVLDAAPPARRATPFNDGGAEPSPEPPAYGSWRRA